MTRNAYIHRNLTSLFSVYFLGMLFFMLFRLALLFINRDRMDNIADHKLSLVMQALWMGIRFDTVISCYILVLPAVICSVLLWFRRLYPAVLKACYIFIEALFVVSFFLCAVDIPFFSQFFSRLNHSVFLWTNNIGMGMRMVLREPRFMVFALLFIVISVSYILLMRRIRKRQSRFLPQKTDKRNIGGYVLMVAGTLVLWGVIFVGIRGRIERKSPIRVGTAYFSNYPFINQLGLNPVYTFMRSCMDAKNEANKPIRMITDTEALEYASHVFGHDGELDGISPVARMQQSYPLFEGRNLVLVIMEGMSMHKMKQPENLTPYLNGLMQQCWAFDSMYSAGVHTFNGIYSTLFSHPALMAKHSMYNYFADRMAGLPNILSDNGYQTAFFIPHDDQFDNIAGFLSGNQVHTIISQKNYPASEVRSSMGVSDGYMFKFSISVLNEMASTSKPFCAIFMTASDHPPYILPKDEGFTPKTDELPKQMTEYADRALANFMADAAKQPWYGNTVFAFVADHGSSLDAVTYDIDLCYHHIPFLIYAPGITEAKHFGQNCLQLDVFPTLAANMGIKFVNNTFGVDLLHQKHENIVFSTDNKLACMNDSLLYVYRTNLPDGLYRYRRNDITDYGELYPEVKEEMRRAAFSWLQTSQWMIDQRKAAVK